MGSCDLDSLVHRQVAHLPFTGEPRVGPAAGVEDAKGGSHRDAGGHVSSLSARARGRAEIEAPHQVSAPYARSERSVEWLSSRGSLRGDRDPSATHADALLVRRRVRACAAVEPEATQWEVAAREAGTQ